jgi:hypothetical protein
LEKVNNLRGIFFNRKDDEIRSVGVIAQEVEKILPEAVRQTENGYMAVSYGNMVGLLIEAIKELKKEIEELKQK